VADKRWPVEHTGTVNEHVVYELDPKAWLEGELFGLFFGLNYKGAAATLLVRHVMELVEQLNG
jgi:hypothetical protein